MWASINIWFISRDNAECGSINESMVNALNQLFSGLVFRDQRHLYRIINKSVLFPFNHDLKNNARCDEANIGGFMQVCESVAVTHGSYWTFFKGMR